MPPPLLASLGTTWTNRPQGLLSAPSGIALPSGPGIQPAINLLATGDSIQQGLTNAMRFFTPMYALGLLYSSVFGVTANLGVSGATLGAQGPTTIPSQLTTVNIGGTSGPSGQQCVVPGRPNFVLLEGGTNDKGNAPVQTDAATLTALQTTVAAWTTYLGGISNGGFGVKHRILIQTCTGRNDGIVLSGFVALVRANYASWATASVDVALVDAASDPHIGLGASVGDFTANFLDGLHLNQAGYALLLPYYVAALGGTAGIAAIAKAVTLTSYVSHAMAKAAGLRFWYRAAGSRVDTSGTGLALDDLSGNGQSILQAYTNNVGSAPTMRATSVASNAAFGNKPSLHFPGHPMYQLGDSSWTNFGDSPGFVQSAPYTMYFVLECSVQTTAGIWGVDTGIYLWLADGVHYTWGNGVAVTTIAADGTPHVFCGVVDGTNITLYVDDHATPKTTYAASPGPTASGYIGSLAGSTVNPTLPFTGDIVDVALCNGAHSAAQRNAIFQALGADYSLPVT